VQSVVAAPGGLRQVDEGSLKGPDPGDEVELSCAADLGRRRRLLDAVGESLESRKRLGDRAGEVDPLGLFERRQQLGDLDPDGREEPVPLKSGFARSAELRLEPGLRQTADDPPNRLGQVLQPGRLRSLPRDRG
jgi:hypothetical protein